MRLGVVSDTHGHIELTQAAVRMLDALEPDVVLHCGDIGSIEIPGMFAAWPTHFVFGNVDYGADQLRKAIVAAGQTCHDRFGSIVLEGIRIALLHSDDGAKFRATIASGEYDLVCYGHTHQAKIERFGATTVLNPGAIYRADPHSIAIVDLPDVEATIITL